MRTKCPHCRQQVELSDWLAGRTTNCPRCGRPFMVPTPLEDPKPEEERARARRRMSVRLSPQTSLVILGVLAIASVCIALFYKMATARYDRQQQEILRNDARLLKAQGDQYWQEGDFKQAREAYKQALATLEEMEVLELTLKKTLEGLMETDELKHLALGEVKFRDHWMTLEDKETLEMTERGLVRLEGEWLPAEEVERRKEEQAKAEEAERLAAREKQLKAEAPAKARQVVEDFLETAKTLAPVEAAERYTRQVVPGSPLDIPRIVLDYTVAEEIVTDGDDVAVENVSRVYAQVKAYVTVSTAEGEERVRWFFKVRKVEEDWHITYAKKED